MSKEQDVIDEYLDKLKDPGLSHDKFVEYTERVRELKALIKES